MVDDIIIIQMSTIGFQRTRNPTNIFSILSEDHVTLEKNGPQMTSKAQRSRSNSEKFEVKYLKNGTR